MNDRKGGLVITNPLIYIVEGIKAVRIIYIVPFYPILLYLLIRYLTLVNTLPFSILPKPSPTLSYPLPTLLSHYTIYTNHTH